jgi:quercetin dioxygenase-like cupin family protein
MMKRLLAMALWVGGAFLLGRVSAQPSGGVLSSFAITWEEIQAKPASGGGRSRSVVRQPTATLEELEMHVTTLPAGQSSHPPHTHPNEETIIVREGTLDAFQNGKTTRVGPGAILFMASNQPHNVTNVGTTPATYHVINWQTAATPKTPRSPAPAPAAK